MKPIEFESALETLILEAFRAGVSLEGNWEVELPSPNVPTWTVEIARHAPENADYDPSFIER